MRSPQINIEPNFLFFHRQVNNTYVIIIPRNIHDCQNRLIIDLFNKRFNL